mgnify:CR=1 FL=1
MADAKIIIAPRFVRIAGRIMSGRSDARAVAIFPFIFIRDESQNMPWLINHEHIHFSQQLETLFIGVALISLIEYLYARLVLGYSKQQAYLYQASEQEAYRNQQDQSYLKNRNFAEYYRYIFNKREFTFGEPGEIRYLDTQ